MLSRTKKNILIQDFKIILKNKGLKATPQRLAVHEAMIDLGHACAEDVLGHISKTERKSTMTSVYNILSQMADLGIYSRRLSSTNKMFFDINTEKHLHLYDIEEHEFKDIMDEEIISYIESKLMRKRFKGYKLDHVEIQLICRPTKKKPTTSTNKQ